MPDSLNDKLSQMNAKKEARRIRNENKFNLHQEAQKTWDFQLRNREGARDTGRLPIAPKIIYEKKTM